MSVWAVVVVVGPPLREARQPRYRPRIRAAGLSARALRGGPRGFLWTSGVLC